jgi:hypothetical protein
VRTHRAGNNCPSCGGENPKGSSFCVSCQAALVEGAVPQQLPDISALVAGAVGAGVGAAAYGDEYVGAAAGDMDFGGHGDFESAGDFGSAGDFADEFAAPPPPPAATAAAPSTASPTGSLDFGDEFSAPPPPPDTVDLDLDDTSSSAAPPPPAGGRQTTDTGSVSGDEDLADWSLDYDE